MNAVLYRFKKILSLLHILCKFPGGKVHSLLLERFLNSLTLAIRCITWLMLPWITKHTSFCPPAYLFAPSAYGSSSALISNYERLDFFVLVQCHKSNSILLLQFPSYSGSVASMAYNHSGQLLAVAPNYYHEVDTMWVASKLQAPTESMISNLTFILSVVTYKKN